MPKVDIIKDTRLSLKAKGLYFIVAETGESGAALHALSKDGRDAHLNAIKELIDNGYIKRQTNRSEGGMFTCTYTVTDYPTPVKPTPEKPTLTIANTKSSNTKRTVKEKVSVSRFVAPTYEEVLGYMKERDWKTPEDQASKFVDFYAAKGWMVGKNKMKDWMASVRTWERKGDNIANAPKKESLTPATKRLYEMDWKSAPGVTVVKAAVYCVQNNVAPPSDLSRRFYNNIELETSFMDACLSLGLEAKLPKSIEL